MRLMRVAVAVTAFFLLCGISFAQGDWRWQGDQRGVWDTHRNDDQDKKAYDHGFRDGQNDRQHRRAAHPRHHDHAYVDGYHAGYGQAGGVWPGRSDRRNDHDADDRGRGPYGRPQNSERIAYDNGFREGLRYGQADRGHHSHRPTDSDNYKHGTTGWMESLGDRNVYKQNFQQGFRAGYDKGYYGR